MATSPPAVAAKQLVDKWFGSFPASTKPKVVTVPAPVVAAQEIAVDDPFAKLRQITFAWHSPAGYPRLAGWHAAVYRLRRFGLYKATFYVLRNWVFPTAIMFWLFWWLAFGTANTLGLICNLRRNVRSASKNIVDL